MARALIDESKPEWVGEADLIQDGDKDVRYHIRPISVDRYRHVVKAHTSQVINRRTHRKEDDIDAEGLSDALLDFCLIGWDGIESEPGVPAVCELAQKKRLPGVLIAAITEYASQTGGATGRSADERKASFRATENVV